jgi:hypothetical protein
MVLGKRKRVVRRKNKKAKSSVSALTRQVRQNTALLRQTVEAKQLYITTSAVLADGDFYQIGIMPGLNQGVADTGTGATVQTGARIGNSINVKHISARINLNGHNYAVNPTNPNGKTGGSYRVIIYNSPCGEELYQSDILREAASTTAAMRSHYNADVAKGKMYQIWYDKTFHLSDANPAKLIQFSKKWKNGKQVIYDNNVSSPSNFLPRMLVVCHDVPSTFSKINFSFKTKYEDL